MTEPKGCQTPGACSCPPMTPDIIAKITAEIERLDRLRQFSRSEAHRARISARIEGIRWVLSLANPQEPTDDR